MNAEIKDIALNINRFALDNLSEGYFFDPILKIVRNRVAAEFANLFLALKIKERASEVFEWLLTKQNSNFSWNEIHPNFDEESALVTSMIGRCLLNGFETFKERKYINAARSAGEFVLSREIGHGHFWKSISHFENCLNVNVTCTAFLKKLYDRTKDERFNDARLRGIINTIKYQFKNGAFPYCSEELTFPFEYHRYVQDIHYQGVTLYYLLLSLHEREKEEFIFKRNVIRAADWLAKQLDPAGTFKWEQSDLIFAQKISAAYGFAAACFSLLGKKYETAYSLCIKKLNQLQLQSGAFLKYEKTNSFGALKGSLRDFLGNFRFASNYRFPFFIRIYNAARRQYREFECEHNNESSMFYTSQIGDCLSEI